MKKTILLLSFLTLMSCKNNSDSENKNTEVETVKTVKKVCDQYNAASAVQSYLIKSGVVEYSSQVKCKATKVNDDCDFRVTATFYLENLYSGDGTKDYMVSFDGNEYFVR